MPLLAVEGTSAEKQGVPVKPSLWTPESKSPQRCHERDGRKRSFPALLGSLVTPLVPRQSAADTKMLGKRSAVPAGTAAQGCMALGLAVGC